MLLTLERGVIMSKYSEHEIMELVNKIKTRLTFIKQNPNSVDVQKTFFVLSENQIGVLDELEEASNVIESLLKDVKDKNTILHLMQQSSNSVYGLIKPNDFSAVYRFDREESAWVISEMRVLKKDDIFIMYEKGLRRLDSKGNTVFVAAEDTKHVEGDIWQVTTLY